ncbi:MAG: cupin domain-containing protein [Chloroflexi bacterium]|nr:cupin domain-containing protein [Chloroflexota bacterium]
MAELPVVAETNPYEAWIKQEGIPVIEGYSVDDAMKVPLQPWKRMGGLGAYLHLHGSDGRTGAYICEIPPGGSLKPERHLFEELIFIWSGEGATTVWGEGIAEQIFQWQEGSLFSPPLNCWHRLVNRDAKKPARFLAVNGAPVFMNLFHNPDFIFNNDFAFKDRYAGQKDYFKGDGRAFYLSDSKGNVLKSVGAVWEGNLVKDVRTFVPATLHGSVLGSTKYINLELSGNTMEAHITQYEVGTYMQAHRHEGGAHVLVLSGRGYSLMWPEGEGKQKFDWHKGSVISPVENWFHQHFVTSREPVMQVALRWGGKTYRFLQDGQWAERHNVIEYFNEDPDVRELFEKELAKEGLKSRMEESFYQK